MHGGVWALELHQVNETDSIFTHIYDLTSGISSTSWKPLKSLAEVSHATSIADTVNVAFPSL